MQPQQTRYSPMPQSAPRGYPNPAQGVAMDSGSSNQLKEGPYGKGSASSIGETRFSTKPRHLEQQTSNTVPQNNVAKPPIKKEGKIKEMQPQQRKAERIDAKDSVLKMFGERIINLDGAYEKVMKTKGVGSKEEKNVAPASASSQPRQSPPAKLKEVQPPPFSGEEAQSSVQQAPPPRVAQAQESQSLSVQPTPWVALHSANESAPAQSATVEERARSLNRIIDGNQMAPYQPPSNELSRRIVIKEDNRSIRNERQPPQSSLIQRVRLNGQRLPPLNDNLSLYRHIQEHRDETVLPADSDLQRLSETLLFFCPSAQKNSKYEQLKKRTKVLGLDRFETLDSVHDAPKLLFSAAVSEISKELRINLMAALYLLGIYLKAKGGEFLRPNVEDPRLFELNIQAFGRNTRFNYEGEPNFDSKLMKDIVAGVTQLYAQETSALLGIFKEICEGDCVEFPSEYFTRAVQSALGCLKQRQDEQRGKSYNQDYAEGDQSKCLELLALMVSRASSIIEPSHIIRLVSKPIEDTRNVTSSPYRQIINGLLRLKSVAMALNGGQRNEQDLELYRRHPSLMDSLDNHRLAVYRAIAPAIRTCLQPNSTFSACRQQLAPNLVGGHWKYWLQIWCYHRNFEESWECAFLVTTMLRVFKSEHCDFWRNINSKQYSSITFALNELMRKRYVEQILAIFTMLLGEKGRSHSEELLNNIGWLCGQSDNRSALKIILTLTQKYRDTLLGPLVLMLARMIELEPWMTGIIERNMNISVLKLLVDRLSPLHQSSIKIHVAVFNALNSILEQAGAMTDEVVGCIQECPPINFELVPEESISGLLYQEYLQALTKHVQLLRKASSKNIKIEDWVLNILEFLFSSRNATSNIYGLELLVSCYDGEEDELTRFLRDKAESKQFDNLPKFLECVIVDAGTLQVTSEGQSRCFIKTNYLSKEGSSVGKVNRLVACLKVVQKCFQLYFKEPRNHQPRLVHNVRDKFRPGRGLFPKMQEFQRNQHAQSSIMPTRMAGELLERPTQCTFVEVLIELMALDSDRLRGSGISDDVSLMACDIIGSLAGIEPDGETKSGYRPNRDCYSFKRLIECSRIALSVGSDERVDGLIRLLTLLVHGNKLLGREIIHKLHIELAQTVDRVLSEDGIKNLPLANKLLILMLQILKDSTLWQTCHFFINERTLLNILQCTFSKFLCFGKRDVSREVMDSHQLLLISNVCLLLSTLLSSKKSQQSAKVLLSQFFKIYSRQTVCVLLTRQPNYDELLLDKQKGMWLTSQFIEQINIKAVSSEEGAIVLANSLAFANWCRLYITIVNENVTDLIDLKRMIQRSEQQLEAFLGELLHFLSYEQISFPEPIYFMIGASVRLNSNIKLAQKIAQKLQWLNNINTPGKVFAAQALYSVGRDTDHQPTNIQALQESIIDRIGPSTELLSLLSGKPRTRGFLSCVINIAIDSFLIDHTKRFATSCTYLMEQLRNGLPVEEVACKLRSLLYELDLSNMQGYANFHRSQKHLKWCWLLLITREMFMQDGNNIELAIFIKFILDRANTITSQGLFSNDWHTPAHLDELALISSVLCTIMVSDAQFHQLDGWYQLVPVSLKIFNVISNYCIREIAVPRSVFEESLNKAVFDRPQNQQASKTAPFTFLRLSTEMTCLEAVWSCIILLLKLFKESDRYLRQILAKDILTIEGSMCSVVSWMHNFCTKLGRSPVGRSQRKEQIQEAIRSINTQLNTAEATLELGFLNTTTGRQSMEDIYETVHDSMAHFSKLMLVHLQNIAAYQGKVISPGRFITLEKCLGHLSPEFVEQPVLDKIKWILVDRRH